MHRQFTGVVFADIRSSNAPSGAIDPIKGKRAERKSWPVPPSANSIILFGKKWRAISSRIAVVSGEFLFLAISDNLFRAAERFKGNHHLRHRVRRLLKHCIEIFHDGFSLLLQKNVPGHLRKPQQVQYRCRISSRLCAVIHFLFRQRPGHYPGVHGPASKRSIICHMQGGLAFRLRSAHEHNGEAQPRKRKPALGYRILRDRAAARSRSSSRIPLERLADCRHFITSSRIHQRARGRK